MGARRNTAGAIALAGVLALGIVEISGATGSSTSTGPPALPPSAGQAAEPVYTPPAGPSLPEHRIGEIAVEFAAQSGDRAPGNVQAINTTLRAALETNPYNHVRASGPSETARDESAVALVTMEGHFTSDDTPAPPGASTPTGTVLTLAIDAHTGWIDYYELTDAPAPGVSALGQLHQLK